MLMPIGISTTRTSRGSTSRIAWWTAWLLRGVRRLLPHTDSFQEEANRIAELSGLDRNSAEMLLGMYDQGCQSQVERTREFVNSIPA